MKERPQLMKDKKKKEREKLGRKPGQDVKGRREKAGRGQGKWGWNWGCATSGTAQQSRLAQNHTLWTKCSHNCLKALGGGDKARLIVSNWYLDEGTGMEEVSQFCGFGGKAGCQWWDWSGWSSDRNQRLSGPKNQRIERVESENQFSQGRKPGKKAPDVCKLRPWTMCVWGGLQGAEGKSCTGPVPGMVFSLSLTKLNPCLNKTVWGL